jgi:hypothetical protein
VRAGLGIGLTLVVICVAAIGIAGTRSATRLGNEIASDELTTSTATGQLARIMDRAYATGEAAFLAPGPAERSRLLGFLYSSLLPAADARLYSLERLHADDPPAERAGLERLVRQWAAVRDLLSPTSLAAQPAATLAARLAAAYQPVSSHLDRLLLNEQHAGRIDRVEASASQAQTMGFIVGAAVLGIGVGALLLRSGIRRSLEPGQDQAEFADTLQIANDEDEAHQLFQRHLERTLTATTAVVLNRNNSADPGFRRPGGPGPGEPPQPGRRGDPRRDRRPDRAAQQACGHGRDEAPVRPGLDDGVAAGAAAHRPRPLQADQ